MPDAELDRLGAALTSACRTAVGDSVRSIVYFTADEYEQVYLREDLETGADVETFVENERVGFDRRATSRGSELGSYVFTIEGFEHGFLSRVIVDDRGVFVTTDPMTMTRFEEMITAVRAVLEDASAVEPTRRESGDR